MRWNGARKLVVINPQVFDVGQREHIQIRQWTSQRVVRDVNKGEVG
jgi:hypothetical protein